jgi:hypothetical protein
MGIGAASSFGGMRVPILGEDAKPNQEVTRVRPGAQRPCARDGSRALDRPFETIAYRTTSIFRCKVFVSVASR